MLTKEDVLFKTPEDGDFILFFRWCPRRKRFRTDVGVISREFDDISWIVSGEVRLKESLLFVLTLEGYEKQQELNRITK